MALSSAMNYVPNSHFTKKKKKKCREVPWVTLLISLGNLCWEQNIEVLFSKGSSKEEFKWLQCLNSKAHTEIILEFQVKLLSSLSTPPDPYCPDPKPAPPRHFLAFHGSRLKDLLTPSPSPNCHHKDRPKTQIWACPVFFKTLPLFH